MNRQSAFSKIDRLIDQDTPRTFPYTVTELVEETGLPRMTIWRYLNNHGLQFNGRHWVYRSIGEKKEEE
jgi:hypothetical protein